MFFDPLYFLFALPAMLLGMWAQFQVQSSFEKYSKVNAASGMSGADAARKILNSDCMMSKSNGWKAF